MNKLKRMLIRKARQKYGKITPCSYRRTLYECFTVYGDWLYFWFNVDGYYTRILKARII